MKLSVAHSPCPNDTYMFHAMATGRLNLPGAEMEFHLHDVEMLNRLALESTYDFTKLSFHAYLQARDLYTLLNSGAALGFGCGPMVVGRGDMKRADLAGATIAVPGEMTTGHLLLRLWAPDARNTVFVRYDRILDMVLGGDADFGVIIHESRFVFEKAGLRAMADLGEWWEGETSLPIPLGCVAAKRTLPDDVVQGFDSILRRSILHARENHGEAIEYTRGFAQELDTAVVSKHVETFVNDFSLGLGEQGLAAVEKLEEMASAAGIFR